MGYSKTYSRLSATAASAAGFDLFLPLVQDINTSARGIKTTATANESHAFGDVCRLNSLNKAQLANATVIENATACMMCIDAAVSADEQGTYLLYGFVRNDAWDFEPGQWIYLSREGSSGNTLTQLNLMEQDDPQEDNVVQLLGIANAPNSLMFNPQLVQVEFKTASEV